MKLPTKKEEFNCRQIPINKFIIDDYSSALESFNSYDRLYHPIIKKFRNCQAEIIETPFYYYLRSYNTIVAYIYKPEKIFVDALRYAYGYTSTSCQPIAKFKNDYKSYYNQEYTYRYIKR